MILKFQAAHGMGDALNGVLNGVGKVIQGVDAPLIALAVVGNMLNAVNRRVTQVHVGAGQVDFGAQGLFAIGKLARAHPAEQVEVFFRGTVAVGGRTAGLTGIVAAVFLHLLAGQVIHIGFAFLNELFGVFIALFKVIAAVKNAAVGGGTQPFQIFQDALHILVAFAGGVGIVKAQVKLTAIGFGGHVVDVNGLGGTNVQVAVRLRRKTGMDLLDLALGKIRVNDLSQKIGKLFVSHVFHSNKIL